MCFKSQQKCTALLHLWFEITCPDCQKTHWACKQCKRGYKCCGRRVSYKDLPNEKKEYSMYVDKDSVRFVDRKVEIEDQRKELERKREFAKLWEEEQKKCTSCHFGMKEEGKIYCFMCIKNYCTDCGFRKYNPAYVGKQVCDDCIRKYCACGNKIVWGGYRCEACKSKDTKCHSCGKPRVNGYTLCNTCIDSLRNCSKCGEYVPEGASMRKVEYVDLRGEFCPHCRHNHTTQCNKVIKTRYEGWGVGNVNIYCECESPTYHTVVICEHSVGDWRNYRDTY